jgi:hypothetical protein
VAERGSWCGCAGGSAARAFYRHLPVEDMVCDVSLFTPRPLVARIYCPSCGLKLSYEAHFVMHADSSHETHPYK